MKLNWLKKMLIILISLVFLIILTLFFIKKIFFNNLSYAEIKSNYQYLRINSEKISLKNIKNDYNFKFLPETQSINIDYNKIKIILPKEKITLVNGKEGMSTLDPTYHLDQFQKNIILANYYGKIYYFENEKILTNNNKSINAKKILSNLKVKKLLNIKIYNEKIYVSFIKDKNNCETFNIMVADFNLEELNFKNFYHLEECASAIQAGKMVIFKHQGLEGLLFSTSNQMSDDTGEDLYTDRIKNKNFPPQSDKMLFGKILFIDFDKINLTVFSKGHRNIQGLFVENDVIISTEHGPKGGDEINKIEFGKNYGWPIASYGEKYATYNSSKNYYAKNHSSYGFEEPIFSYVPSIAISEIMKLPNQFSPNFENNYLITSLAALELRRIKFDEKFSKILFDERIYVGERIRDIEFVDELNVILLAFDDNGTIGILKKSLED